jgi:hypothetical protein
MPITAETSMWIALLPVVTTGMGAVLTGLLFWRYQLRAKRRAEVAEEALLAFLRAVDTLETIRNPYVFPEEQQDLRKKVGGAVGTRLKNEDFSITLWRLGQHRDEFVALRKAQLLCQVHFGQEADDAFKRLGQVRNRIWSAAFTGTTAREEPMTPEEYDDLRLFKEIIWADYGNPDHVKIEVEAAQARIEAILTPYLRTGMWMLPELRFGWQATRERVIPRLDRWWRGARDWLVAEWTGR